MNASSLANWVSIRLLGPLYSLLYYSTQHRFLGPTIRGWLQFLPFLLALVTLIQRWPRLWLLAWLFLYAIIRLAFWMARKNGYIGFIRLTDRDSLSHGQPLADGQKVIVWATGLFSVEGLEEYVLLLPTAYWRFPTGDHVLMVEYRPGRYLYQFIQPGALRRIEAGQLIHGIQPRRALEITFLTTWGPKPVEVSFNFFTAGENSHLVELQRTIYVVFRTEEEQESVWRNLTRASQPTIDRSYEH